EPLANDAVATPNYLCVRIETVTGTWPASRRLKNEPHSLRPAAAARSDGVGVGCDREIESDPAGNCGTDAISARLPDLSFRKASTRSQCGAASLNIGLTVFALDLTMRCDMADSRQRRRRRSH